MLSNGSVQGVIVADKLDDSRRDGHMAERLRPTPPGTQSCPESDIQGHKQHNTSDKDCACGCGALVTAAATKLSVCKIKSDSTSPEKESVTIVKIYAFFSGKIFHFKQLLVILLATCFQ